MGAFERARTLVVIKPGFLVPRTEEQLDIKDAIEAVETVSDAEEAEKDDRISPEDVVVVVAQANRIMNSRRIAVLRYIDAEKKRLQKEKLLAQGVKEENILDSDLEAVELEDDDVEYILVLQHVSVVVGSIEYGAKEQQNFEPPPYTDIDAWLNDVPDWIFDPVFSCAVMANDHWINIPSRSPKNRWMPG